MRLTWIEGACVVAIVLATVELHGGERRAHLAALTAIATAGAAAVVRLAASPRSPPDSGSAPEGSAAPARGSLPFGQ